MRVKDVPLERVVSVPANFWPLFFTSDLNRQFVGETVCFGLIDQGNKTQIIVLIPAIEAVQMPSIAEIRRHFPPYSAGRPYHDPGELPVSIDDLAAVAGFELSKFEDATSTIYLLVPQWRAASSQRPETFHYLRFETLEQESAARILEALADEEIIFSRYDKDTGEFRAIFNVEGKYELTFNDGVCLLRTRRGDFIIPTLPDGKTMRGNTKAPPVDYTGQFLFSLLNATQVAKTEMEA